MNSSVPEVSPPLIEAAATRMPTITTTMAQNSVVLNACLVSVENLRIALLRLAERSVSALTPPARVVADSMLVPPRWCVPKIRALQDETTRLGQVIPEKRWVPAATGGTAGNPPQDKSGTPEAEGGNR